jgi:hypothetical protein
VQLASGSQDWEEIVTGDSRQDRSAESNGMVSSEKDGAEETNKTIEPEDIESNPIHSGSETTVALGYNVLVVRRPAPERRRISHRYLEVERFYSNAQRFSPIESSDESILRLLREDLASSFWKYGYHTVGFGPPGFFGTAPDPQKIGFGTVDDTPWVSPDDAALEQKNVLLERSEKPAKGLEAIFDRQSGDEFRSLNSDAWKRLGFHQRISQSMADSRTMKNFSEAYFLNPGGRYLADLVAAYQDWSEDQWQNRFFQVVDLLGAGAVDVSLQNLMGGLIGDFSNLFKVTAWRKIAREDGMDRAFDQLIQSLRARRLLHRTVIVVLESSSLPDGRLSTRPYLMIPGLKAKRNDGPDRKNEKDVNSESKIVALREAIRGAVGATQEEDENLGEAARDVPAQRDPGFRVRLSFLPIVRECGRIRWRSAQPLVGLASKNIKTEGQPESGFIDMFPCSGAGSSWVSWSQSQQLDLAGELGKVFGGQLIEEIGSSGEHSFALFYGPQMLSAAELRLSQLFSVDPSFLLSQSKFFVDPEKRLAQRLKDGAEELTKSLKFVGLIEAIPNHEVDLAETN